MERLEVIARQELENERYCYNNKGERDVAKRGEQKIMAIDEDLRVVGVRQLCNIHS